MADMNKFHCGSINHQEQQQAHQQHQQQQQQLQQLGSICPCCGSRLRVNIIQLNGQTRVELFALDHTKHHTGMMSNILAGTFQSEHQWVNNTAGSFQQAAFPTSIAQMSSTSKANDGTNLKSTRKNGNKISVDGTDGKQAGAWNKQGVQVMNLPNFMNAPINIGLPGSSPGFNSSVTLICSHEGCKKLFTEVHQFNLHMKKHDGEKVYTCNWIGCERLFSTKQRLNDHVRFYHTGERPYVCEICKKAFSSSKNLRAHKLLHTGERPYKCIWEGCKSKFRRSHHLTAHRRIHTGERPFPCYHPGCNLAFTKSDHAKRHYLTHFKKSKASSINGPSLASLDLKTPATSTANSGTSSNSVNQVRNEFSETFNQNNQSSSYQNDDDGEYLGGVEAIVVLDEKEGIIK